MTVLEALLRPRSIAIVGASRRPNKVGNIILRNLLASGYRGKIYPVNPAAPEILGFKAYPSLRKVPGDVDMVVVAIPAEHVLQVVDEAAEKNAKVLVVISSGFSEVGRRDLEERLVRRAREKGIRVLGPNIFGVVYTPWGLNATFGPSMILRGRIALITQSGALGVALMGWTSSIGVGLSAVVSVGNMADLGFDEISEVLAEDPETRVITLYIEGIKPGTGKRFIEKMRSVSLRKPVVAFKSGRTSRGSAAASSHTGSLAGSDRVYQAAFEQSGVLRAMTLEEMFDWARAFAEQPLPRGNKIVIITNGGGVGVIATDAAEEQGLRLIDPPDDLVREFRKHMPWFGSARNPVDLTGMAAGPEYSGAVEAALKHPDVDGVIVLYCETGLVHPRDLAEALIETYRRVRDEGVEKPMLVSMIGGDETNKALVHLDRRGIPAYPMPERAVSAMAAMIRYKNWLDKALPR